MTATATNPMKAPPAPPPLPPSAKAEPSRGAPKSFSISRGITRTGHRAVIYGPGGVGKTSLAALAPTPLFFDLEGGSEDFDLARLPDPKIRDQFTWQDLRDMLHSKIVEDFETVVIDTGTTVQDLAVTYTLKHVPHEKGYRVDSVEGYGYGKGYQYVYETFLCLLSDLDAQIRAGRNVVMCCHVRTETAPNPEGEDYLRYEPDLLQPPKTGRLRDRVRNWTDHLLYVGFDVAVIDGKATGSGTRTIYPQEVPTFWAKSRTLREPIPYVENDDTLWKQLTRKETT